MMEKFHTQKQGLWHVHELYNAIARCFSESDLRRPFSHAIVDELQDLSNVELRLLRALVDEGPNDLMLVGDPLQGIYRRKINFSKLALCSRKRASDFVSIIGQRKKSSVLPFPWSGVHFDDFDGGEESKKRCFVDAWRSSVRLLKNKMSWKAWPRFQHCLRKGPSNEIAVGCRKRSG